MPSLYDDTWERFPTDEVSLTMLAAACAINPETGHTELGRFLEMTGGPVTRVTNEATGEVYVDQEEALAAASVYDQDGAPVFFVEYDKPPHSEHTIIVSLIEEIRRQRAWVTHWREAAERRELGRTAVSFLTADPKGSGR